MENIMRALLEAKYPSLNANTLLEIANQTCNPRVAIEKLCNIHKPTTMSELGMYRVSSSNVEYTLVSINEWSEEVIYSYLYEDTVSFYVDKGIDKSVVTIDNMEQYKVKSGSDNATWITIKTGKLKETTGSMSFGSWVNLKTPELKD